MLSGWSSSRSRRRCQLLDLLVVEGVIEAEHGDAVLHRREAIAGGSAHPLAGAVGGDQLGILLLQLQQLAVEAVIDRVLHLGCIEHVVGVGGLIQQLAEFWQAGDCGGHLREKSMGWLSS